MSISCSDINTNKDNANNPGKHILKKIRCSHSKPGPTSDMSSRISRLRKIQTKSIANAPNGDGTMSYRRAQRFGVQQDKHETHGVNGDASQHIYFRSIFTRVNTHKD